MISVYTTGATTTGVTTRVTAAPAGQRAAFDIGCGKGTSACALGTVAVGAAIRQMQAQIAVPAKSSVTAVRLTATVTANHLPKAAQASVAVAVTAGIGAPLPLTNFLTKSAFLNPAYLPLVSPNATKPGLSLLPGGTAAGLFPELTPGQNGSGSVNSATSGGLASTGLSLAGNSLANGQVAGLVALVLATLLAGSARVRGRISVAFAWRIPWGKPKQLR